MKDKYQDPNPRVVIACRVIRAELERLRIQHDAAVEVHYLDQNLHRTPERMSKKIQSQIDAVAGHAAEIILGYGLCSNGIAGVRAVNQPVYIPRAHDCITLLLGSRDAYQQAFSRRPGTYYLTPGWIAEKKDPLGMMENEYAPKMGRKTAEWGIREELKHYTHIVFINTGTGNIALLRERAQRNAAFLEKEFEEMTGSTRYFQKILSGPYEPPDFVCIPPGEKVSARPFLND